MKSEDIVEMALKSAKDKGIQIVRGPVFDWRDRENPFQNGEIPSACNATGALLLHFSLQDFVKGEFKNGWIDKLCEASGLTWPWIWRFNHGWDRGDCLSVTYTDKGKEHTSEDEASKNGNRMAKEWVQ